MKKTLLLLLTLAITSAAFSQKYKAIDILVDSGFFGVKNILDVKVILTKKNGKKVVLESGDIYANWNKIKVSSNLFTGFSEGILYYKADLPTASNHLMTITVADRKGTISKTIRFPVPYVKEVHAYNAAVMVNEPTVFDYWLRFSNGRKGYADKNFFDPAWLQLQSDYPLTMRDGKLLLKTNKLIPFGQIQVSMKDTRDGALLGEMELKISYPSTASFLFSGRDGVNGLNGHNGSNYSESGSDGQSGGDGQHAPSVKMIIEPEMLNNRLFLNISCYSSDHRSQQALLQFDKKKIVLDAKGGNGGNGGNGGDGRSGLIDKEKGINSPNGGNSGHGGNAGRGGNGGEVIVLVDSSLAWIGEYLEIKTNGGANGIPGKEGCQGHGDYENSTLLGTIFSVRRGDSGQAGQAASSGFDGNGGKLIVLPGTEFAKTAKDLRLGQGAY
jgi:hypothetical protein